MAQNIWSRAPCSARPRCPRSRGSRAAEAAGLWTLGVIKTVKLYQLPSPRYLILFRVQYLREINRVSWLWVYILSWTFIAGPCQKKCSLNNYHEQGKLTHPWMRNCQGSRTQCPRPHQAESSLDFDLCFSIPGTHQLQFLTSFCENLILTFLSFGLV